jgi:FMN phosphatase YigB (HAD superfamily)
VSPRVRAVFFDLGETLVDETTMWMGWARWLGAPPFTVMGLVGATIGQRVHHDLVFDLFQVDPGRERAAKTAAGVPHGCSAEDLYADALPCLETLHGEGYLLGIAGNTAALYEEAVRSIGLPVDVIASSEGLGVHKPSIEFFQRICALAGVQPVEAAYVGDRLDNDVLPAKQAGMVSVFIRRGPWGYLHATWPEAAEADIRIDSLEELPDRLRHL